MIHYAADMQCFPASLEPESNVIFAILWRSGSKQATVAKKFLDITRPHEDNAQSFKSL